MDIEAWIGRQDSDAGMLASDQVARLAATLDRSAPPAGANAPPLTHWLAFLSRDPQSELGPDGHPRRGGFLPSVDHLPRRMWAGSRIEFPEPLPTDTPLVRTSTVEDVTRKHGRAGELLFVTVRHELGVPGAAPAVIDRHDIV